MVLHSAPATTCVPSCAYGVSMHGPRSLPVGTISDWTCTWQTVAVTAEDVSPHSTPPTEQSRASPISLTTKAATTILSTAISSAGFSRCRIEFAPMGSCAASSEFAPPSSIRRHSRAERRQLGTWKCINSVSKLAAASRACRPRRRSSGRRGLGVRPAGQSPQCIERSHPDLRSWGKVARRIHADRSARYSLSRRSARASWRYAHRSKGSRGQGVPRRTSAHFSTRRTGAATGALGCFHLHVVH